MIPQPLKRVDRKLEFDGSILVVTYEIAIGTEHRQRPIVRIRRTRRHRLNRGGSGPAPIGVNGEVVGGHGRDVDLRDRRHGDAGRGFRPSVAWSCGDPAGLKEFSSTRPQAIHIR